MEIYLEGTASRAGLPATGCACAACLRATTARRRPTSIVVNRRVRLTPGQPPGDTPGFAVVATGDGADVTGPDGARLLFGGTAPPDAGPYDVVVFDVREPAALGELRRRGLVTAATWPIAVGVGHEISSAAELERRLGFWRALAVPDGTVVDTREPAPAWQEPPLRTLLLGGSRSGKSEEAELRLAAEPYVTYVATGPSVAAREGDDGSGGDGGGDVAWRERVRAHRERRPAHWRTAETTDLTGLLGTADPIETGPLLIDGLGTWMAAVFDDCAAWDAAPDRLALVERRCDDLVAAWRRTRTRLVAVSDEVGLGVIPATASGRLFRDALGRLNQRLALESETAALIVAGRPLALPI